MTGTKSKADPLAVLLPEVRPTVPHWLLARVAQIRRFGRKQRKTFADAAEHYIRLYDDKPSIEWEISVLKEMLPFIGHLPLDQIYDGNLKAFIDAQLCKPLVAPGGTEVFRVGVKTTTINLKLGVLRHILILAGRSWRDEDGQPWLKQAPLISMLDGGDERPPRQLSWAEQREHFPKLPPHLHRMALFDLNCGVRESVVCNLQWKWEVQIPEADTIGFIVPTAFVKGRRGKKVARLLVCNSVSRELVEAARGEHPEYVFTYQHNRARARKGLPRANYTPKPPAPIQTCNNSAWQRWRERCGLGDLHVHDLRHTVGMRLREAGVSEETRRDILWHSNKSMTTHYSASAIFEIKEALEKVTSPTHAVNRSLASIISERAPS